MIVVDVNVLVYCWLPGEKTLAAKAVLRKDAQWRVPLLWRSECLNILSGYLRAERLSYDQAFALISRMERWLGGKEHRPRVETTLKCVRQSSCSAYDCEYVAVAHTLGVPLVTEDRLILEAFPQIALSMDAFIAR